MIIVLSLVIALAGFGFAMAFIFGPKAPVRSDVENVTGKKISPYSAALLHRRLVDGNELIRMQKQELFMLTRDRENEVTRRFHDQMDRSLNRDARESDSSGGF